MSDDPPHAFADLRVLAIAKVARAFSIRRVVGAAASITVDQVHEHHADFVWRTLQRLGVRDADVEDALQEVFIVVHRKLDTFDGSARLTTWLYGICLRVAAAHRRKAYVRLERTAPDAPDPSDDDPAKDPEAALLLRESRAQLEQVLGVLSLEKRAVLVMFEVEGFGAGEIAELLGVPIGTVYSRLSAARADFTEAALRALRREKGSGKS